MTVNLRQHKFLKPIENSAVSVTTAAIPTKDYRNVIVTVAYDAAFAGTIKFLGSAQNDAPDFSSAKSLTNLWSGVQVKDREDDDAKDGNTGVVVTASAANVFMYEFNANLLSFIAVAATRTAGTYTITITGTTNA